MISPYEFRNAFLGIIPSTILTVAKDGTPNVAYLGQVHLISESQVALTTQFFNKTKSNFLENPYCTVRVYEPDSFLTYEINACYLRTETAGETFDKMAERLAAIADYSGTPHEFRLQAIEVLEILDIDPVPFEAVSKEELPLSPPKRNIGISFESFQRVCERISDAQNMDDLFDSLLQSIDLEFGLRHSMILVPNGEVDHLLMISSRGYDQSGIGAEVKTGEGVIGRAAELKKPLVHVSLSRDLLYARSSAVGRPAETQNEEALARAIPLPGLTGANSQMAVPILLRGELIGVLFAESENIFEFRDSDESILNSLSKFVGLAMHSLNMTHRLDMDVTSRKLRPTLVHKPGAEKAIFTYFAKEDCILLNGEYLIRSTPARILWKILSIYKEQAKTEFTNRELRLDPWLQLPEVKDNLETRLILLRKRLERKCSTVSLISAGRGRLSLSVSGDVVLNKN